MVPGNCGPCKAHGIRKIARLIGKNSASRSFSAVTILILLLSSGLDGIFNNLHHSIGTLLILKALRGTQVYDSDRENILEIAGVWLQTEIDNGCRLKSKTLYNLGLGYFYLKDENRAIEKFDELVQSGCLTAGDFRLSDSYARLGKLYVGKREPVKALSNLELALSNLPIAARGYFASNTAVLLAMQLNSTGQTEKAVQYFIYAVESDRDNHEPYHRLMEIFNQSKDYEAVLYWYERLRAIAPTDPWGPFFLGQMYFEQRMYTEAVIHFRHAVDLDPSSESAHFWLGVSFASMEDWEHAVQELNAALQQNPDFSYYHGLLGEFYLKLGRDADAAREFERAR